MIFYVYFRIRDHNECMRQYTLVGYHWFARFPKENTFQLRKFEFSLFRIKFDFRQPFTLYAMAYSVIQYFFNSKLLIPWWFEFWKLKLWTKCAQKIVQKLLKL